MPKNDEVKSDTHSNILREGTLSNTKDEEQIIVRVSTSVIDEGNDSKLLALKMDDLRSRTTGAITIALN